MAEGGLVAVLCCVRFALADRASATAKPVEALPTRPVVNLRIAVEITGASEPAVLRAFERLQRAGVLRQTSVAWRSRAFECVGLFALMDGFEGAWGQQRQR